MKILDQLMQRGEAHRDRYLIEAFSLVPGRSFHIRVTAFGRQIARFETAFHRNHGKQSRRLTAFSEAILRARKANGGPLPTDEYDLAKILYSGDRGQTPI